MGCSSCGGRKTADGVTVARVGIRWFVNGKEYATIAEAKTAAKEQGASIQRVIQ